MLEKVKTFLKEVQMEMKKVAWPNKKAVANMTKALLACIVIVSAYIFVLDVLFIQIQSFFK